MAWPALSNPARTRARRWASHLPDGLVILLVLLVGLLLVSLLTAAIAVILAQFLRLAGGDAKWVRIVSGMIGVLAVALVIPILITFAWFVEMLQVLVGTLCPSCRRRELEWRSGSWRYGDPPDYHHFACGNCGAKYRQLYGGQGVQSELELERA